MSNAAPATAGFFKAITERPKLVLALAALLIAAGGAGLGKLVKDTSVRAFIPAGHPSLIAEDRVTEIFGLSDPIAVAVITKDGRSVFEPATLAVVADLTDRIAELPNIRPHRVTSLATESSISGDDESLYVDPYIDPFEINTSTAADARRRWLNMEAHQASLVSADETGAVIMAELVDQSLAADTYETVLAIAGDVENENIAVHVAGPGAVSGYLSRYIDQDARKLQPLVFVLVIGFIYLAFRRAGALPGPLLVVAGSAAGALGIMAWFGVPYFAITNALPVIIVAISVADAIHILSDFYQRREQQPALSTRETVVASMSAMARPITLTTITTISGFAGIAAVSIMPPITWFAIFAAVGVALAWIFSMIALPNVLLLLDPGHSPAFAGWAEGRPSPLGRFLVRFGTLSPLRYRSVLAAFLVVTSVAAVGALQLRIDRSQVENFAPTEAIRIADETINSTFAGTAFLDVIVEADAADGLLTAERMRRIGDLQDYFETLPHVQKSVSIVDYLSELDTALAGEGAQTGAARRLPEGDTAIGQYLALYRVTGDPTDLDEEIDRDHRIALVRGVLDARYFSETRGVVEALERYLDDEFTDDGLRATLAGNVNVSYHWMQSLKLSHFEGVALSLALVFVTSAVFFRSLVVGLISVVPVVFTVLALYACMGYLGIYLEPATSMFAAIALGVGVDFAIHLVDRLQTALQENDGHLAAAIDKALPPVARACFFNSAALGLGFSVLMVSDLPTLTRFGGLVTLAAFSSYLVALVIVPALFAARADWFSRAQQGARAPRLSACLAALLVLPPLLAGDRVEAQEMTAEKIIEQITSRKEGRVAKRRIRMTLTDTVGRSEERLALVHKQSDDEEKHTRVTFLEPKYYRDMAFLSREPLAEDDGEDRWMFNPALRKPRRIPPGKRGGSFFGTDFSYEDIQSELKFDAADWNFELIETLSDRDRNRYRIRGVAKTKRIARELGYGAFQAIVDSEVWMPVRIEFDDRAGRPLKTIEVIDWDIIDGIPTPLDVRAADHQRGHETRLEFLDIEYPDGLPQQLFDAQALSRGLPRSED